MEKSESIGKLVEALAKAQAKFSALKKDTENPYYHSKYADLSQVIAATQSALSAEGLVVVQTPISNERTAGVRTILAHSSGEWIASECLLPAVMTGKDGRERFDSQSVGSAITYARRYSYQAVIGVAAETDDDGNLAVGIGSKEAANAVAEQKIAEYKAKHPEADLTPVLEASIAQVKPKINQAPPPVQMKGASTPREDDVYFGILTAKLVAKPGKKRFVGCKLVLPSNKELEFNVFANPTYPDKTDLFGRLCLKASQPATFVLKDGKINPKTNEPYLDFVDVLKLGDTEFHDGAPAIQRRSELDLNSMLAEADSY